MHKRVLGREDRYRGSCGGSGLLRLSDGRLPFSQANIEVVDEACLDGSRAMDKMVRLCRGGRVMIQRNLHS